MTSSVVGTPELVAGYSQVCHHDSSQWLTYQWLTFRCPDYQPGVLVSVLFYVSPGDVDQAQTCLEGVA